MKARSRIIPVILALAVACSDTPTASGGPDPTPEMARLSVSGSPRDIAAIEQIVATFDQTWGDASQAATYAGQYAGAEWVGPTGLVLTDLAAITSLYTAIFTFALPGTTRESTIRSLTFLTGTVAVLDIDTRVTGFTSPPPGVVPWQPGVIRAREKNILLKRSGQWSIVQHQQTSVAPGVP
jgi:hypothetical protein